MDTALLIGGTRFIGRHTVDELREHGYSVTTFTRGESGNPFADDPDVGHVTGDRNDREMLEHAREAADPDLVVDLVGYFPRQVREATEVFEDSRYVFVSSGSAYDSSAVPLREDAPLHDCTAEQAAADSPETYGPRKAECDREVFRAAKRGVDARSIRPMLVYGPHDYTERFAYWTHRAATADRVLVPGDGGSLLGRAFVRDVASGIRTVAEEGAAGEAYNVADRDAVTLERSVRLAAAGVGRDVEVVGASPRELASAGVEPDDFVLYTAEPMLTDSSKLARLGWESTPVDEAIAETVRAHEAAGRTGAEHDPGREAEEAVLDRLEA